MGQVFSQVFKVREKIRDGLRINQGMLLFGAVIASLEQSTHLEKVQELLDSYRAYVFLQTSRSLGRN